MSELTERIEALEKENKRLTMTTLCSNCGLFEHNRYCGSPDAPYTEFVYGRKDSDAINTSGRCPYYEEKKEGN